MRLLLLITLSLSSFCLMAQENTVNIFTYETIRKIKGPIPPLENKITIYQRAGQTYEELADPYDKDFVPKPRFRTTVEKPYGAFYFDRADSSAVWIRLLTEGDTLRAETTHEPETWTLLPDTATIEGFFCKKAHRIINDRGWSVTAWYTEDLGPDVHAMPQPYLGLPGVLVKSNQFATMRLSSVQLAVAGPTELRPTAGKLKSLKKWKSAKSKAQSLMDVMPLGSQ